MLYTAISGIHLTSSVRTDKTCQFIFAKQYIINTYLLGARETVCFVIPRLGDVSRGAAEGNIGGRGITKHTAFPRAQ